MCKGDFILLSGASFGLVGRRLGGSKIWAERLHRKMKYQQQILTTAVHLLHMKLLEF